MLRQILDELGLPEAETYHVRQPNGSFVAWGLAVDAEGSDFDNEIRRYSASLELYEPVDAQTPEAHERLQSLLDENGLSWKKEERVYLIDVRLFMTGYTFEYTDRR